MIKGKQQEHQVPKRDNFKHTSSHLKSQQHIYQLSKPLEFLQYDQPTKDSDIDMLQKKVSSVFRQYGPAHEKTSRIVVSYVQKLKDKAEEKLSLEANKKESYAYFAKALSFNMPNDKNNHAKMLILKVNIALRLFHELFPAHQAELLITYITTLLDESQHKFTLKKNFYLKEEMIRFLMGFLHYKHGKYPEAINSYDLAKESIDNKFEIIAKSKKNQTQDDRQLQAQEHDMVRLMVKVLASMSKCYMKQCLQKESLISLQTGIALVNQRRDSQFEKVYLEKKRRQVQGFFQVKKQLAKVQLNHFKAHIETEMPQIIQEAKTKNHSLYKYSFTRISK